MLDDLARDISQAAVAGHVRDAVGGAANADVGRLVFLAQGQHIEAVRRDIVGGRAESHRHIAARLSCTKWDNGVVNATAASETAIIICSSTTQARLVPNISTIGDQIGLMIQGR